MQHNELQSNKFYTKVARANQLKVLHKQQKMVKVFWMENAFKNHEWLFIFNKLFNFNYKVQSEQTTEITMKEILASFIIKERPKECHQKCYVTRSAMSSPALNAHSWCFVNLLSNLDRTGMHKTLLECLDLRKYSLPFNRNGLLTVAWIVKVNAEASESISQPLFP